MMVVQTRTSNRPSSKSSMTRSSMPSAIWPWPMAISARGTRRRTRSAAVSIVSTRLCTKKTWPPRSSSRLIASRTRPSSSSAMRVWIGSRASGGVSMTDRSRMPTRLRCRVRGIGVADRVSTSTSLAERLDALLVRHAEALLLVDDQQAQVGEGDVLRQDPMRPDQRCRPCPSATPSTIFSCCRFGTKRLSIATSTGNGAEPPLEGVQVLLRQHGGRHQHRHLLAVLHRLEGGAQRDLGLAVADVAARPAGPSAGGGACRP